MAQERSAGETARRQRRFLWGVLGLLLIVGCALAVRAGATRHPAAEPEAPAGVPSTTSLPPTDPREEPVMTTSASSATPDPRLTPTAPPPPGTTWAVMQLEPAEPGARPDPGKNLAGTTWRQIPTGTYPWYGAYAQLEFTEDQVTATGGCNMLFGGYSVQDGRLLAPAIGSTQRLCEDDGANAMDHLIQATLHDAVLVREQGRLYLGAYVPQSAVPRGWASDGRLGKDATNPSRPLPPYTPDAPGPHTFPGPRDE